jgi:cobyrinic acid a,c-diamide synthase
MKAVLIAGTASGVGKTTVALGLMAGLRARGLVVQPFKCGPDFIDAGHHSAACGRASRNLDTWMLSGEANRQIFANASAGADIAVVEGMMGLFDGVAGGREEGSSAEIAKLLDLPVVLVIDAKNSARSVAAVALGFEKFDPELRLEGLILDRVAGEHHFRLLESAIRSATSVPVLGWLPSTPAVAIPERHLGLHTAAENTNRTERLAALAALAPQHFELGLFMQFESSVPAENRPGDVDLRNADPVRVGVGRDQAFSFYYEDNLDALRELGAEIVEWSPLHDKELPSDIHALYIGGGYPELYAAKLSENRALIRDVKEFSQSGKPIYAECGGMMYLAEELRTSDGLSFPMAGVLPISVEMTERLVHFGYTDVEFGEDCLLGEKGTVVRGHSFHCSRVAETSTHTSSGAPAYRVRYSLSGETLSEGYIRNNVLASYIHLHFRSNPLLAQTFVNRTRSAKGLTRVAS